MLTRRSTWSGLLYSAAVMAALGVTWPALSWAQEAAPATAPAPTPDAAPASAPASAPDAAPAAEKKDNPLKTLTEDFIHYSIVANIPLARDNGQAILNASADPKAVLAAFEAASKGREGFDARTLLLRDQRVADLKDVSVKLLDKLEEGYRATARDPQRIIAEIDRLGDSPRAFASAKSRLNAAGAYAVPFYVQYLQNEKKKDLHPYIIRVMGEIGRPLLPALVEELRTPAAPDKLTVIQVLGEIGYPQAVPYLKAVAADSQADAQVRKAAGDAAVKIDPRKVYANLGPAEAYLSLAEEYYQKRPAVMLAAPGEATLPVWFFDGSINNVYATPVPTAAWHTMQAMRLAEAALKLQPNNAQAISLWLAANLKREVALAGAKDPTRAENAPDATYYAVAAGPAFLNPVLQMALSDRDTILALKAVQCLEATGGTRTAVASKTDASPLVKALNYPDRGVRFAAAFALAQANPSTAYPGYFRVVPVLSEAIAQTGTPNILLVDANQENQNRLKAALAGKGYNVFVGVTLSGALEQARKAAAFEFVIVPNGPEAARLMEVARTDYRLAATPALVTTSADHLAEVRAQLAATGAKGCKELDVAADEAGVNAALSALRTDIGQTPVDAAAATTYATTAIKLLGTLAADHACIYNVNEGLPALIEALKDKRPEVLTATAAVLGEMVNPEAQKALAPVAIADHADNAVRVSLFNALAESARHAGNNLDSDVIDGLIKVVSTPDLDPAVRNASAAALGALNVTTNQASTLILKQAK